MKQTASDSIHAYTCIENASKKAMFSHDFVFRNPIPVNSFPTVDNLRFCGQCTLRSDFTDYAV